MSEQQPSFGNAPLDYQVGGDHYRVYSIQPVEFIQRNNIPFCEGNIIKYAARHQFKGRAQDVEKIIHYAKLLLQINYSYTTDQIQAL